MVLQRGNLELRLYRIVEPALAECDEPLGVDGRMKASRKTKVDQESSGLDERAIERLTGKEGVTLPSLVNDLSRDLGYGTDRVIEGLMGLQKRKLVVVSEKTPY